VVGSRSGSNRSRGLSTLQWQWDYVVVSEMTHTVVMDPDVRDGISPIALQCSYLLSVQGATMTTDLPEERLSCRSGPT
jgi:hypothetical protein